RISTRTRTKSFLRGPTKYSARALPSRSSQVTSGAHCRLLRRRMPSGPPRSPATKRPRDATTSAPSTNDNWARVIDGEDESEGYRQKATIGMPTPAGLHRDRTASRNRHKRRDHFAHDGRCDGDLPFAREEHDRADDSACVRVHQGPRGCRARSGEGIADPG